MTAAQKDFDRCAIPECPSQFAAPTLHAVLGDETLAELLGLGRASAAAAAGSARSLFVDQRERRC